MTSWFSPLMRGLREVLHEFSEPYVRDPSRFDRTFAAVVTPHEEAVRRTVAWYRFRASEKPLLKCSGRQRPVTGRRLTPSRRQRRFTGRRRPVSGR